MLYDIRHVQHLPISVIRLYYTAVIYFFTILTCLAKCSYDPLPGESGVLVGDLNAGGGVALQNGGQDRGAAAGEGVQDMATRLGDLYHIPHKLERFLSEVDTVLGIAVFEHAGQAGHRAADGHVSVRPPHDVLRLLPEPPLLGPAVALVPHSGAPPNPPRPLEGVGGGGELPPVDKHTYRRARLTGPPGLIQPLRRPPGPGPLVLGVAVEGRRRMVTHAGILLGCGLVLLRLGPPAGRIGRVGDDGVEGAGGETAQQPQGVALDDLPAGVIVHAQFYLSSFEIFLETV